MLPMWDTLCHICVYVHIYIYIYIHTHIFVSHASTATIEATLHTPLSYYIAHFSACIRGFGPRSSASYSCCNRPRRITSLTRKPWTHSSKFATGATWRRDVPRKLNIICIVLKDRHCGNFCNDINDESTDVCIQDEKTACKTYTTTPTFSLFSPFFVIRFVQIHRTERWRQPLTGSSVSCSLSSRRWRRAWGRCR